MATDYQTLFEQSKCYLCYGISEFEALELALLAQIAGGSAPPVPVAPAIPTNIDISIASVNGSTIVTWGNTDVPTTNEIWSSTDNITFALLSSVAGGIHTYTDVAAIPANSRKYYKVRACNGVTCSLYTAVVSVASAINYAGAAAGAVSEPTLKVIYGNYNFSGSAALLSVTLAALKKITGSFTGTGCGAITSFVADAMTICSGSIDISFNGTLTTYSTTGLITLGGGLFLGGTMITQLLLPVMSGSPGGDFQVQQNNALVTINMASVQTPNGNFVMSDCPVLTTVIITAMSSLGGRLDVGNCVSLLTLSGPALAVVGDSIVGPSSGVATINMPSLVALGTDMDFDSAAALVTVNVPNVMFPDGHVVNFPGCALNQASVDLILARGVASGTTASDYELFGGTSSAPSAAGLINKGLLIGAGNTVNTN